MFKIILFFFLLFSSFSWAVDQPRMRFSFKSDNQRFELKPCDTLISDGKVYQDSIFDKKTNSYMRSTYTYSDRYHWGLYDNLTNEKLYTIKNDSLFIEHLSVEISNDGENLIFVDDYSGGYGFKFMPVVTFYERDHFIKRLVLNDFMDNMCAITYSVSHMYWCSNWGFTENGFFVSTNDFYRTETNLKGEIISRVSRKEIGPNDNLIRATIHRIGNNKYKVQVNLSIRGNLVNGETFVVESSDRKMRKIHGNFYGFLKSRNAKMAKGFYATVIINNAKIRKVDFPTPIYNSKDNCSYFSKIDIKVLN